MLLYPKFADYWNSLHQSQAIASYAEAVAEMDNSKNEEIMAAAHAYNDALKCRPVTYALTDEEKEKIWVDELTKKIEDAGACTSLINKDNGTVTVTLDGDHQFFTIVVEDTGIGIPEDSIAHIYERFYRVDKSHSREIGGTGLGLAITKNAILMHHGAIKVTSAENVGSIFTIKIPKNHIVVADENKAPSVLGGRIKVRRNKNKQEESQRSEKQDVVKKQEVVKRNKKQ